MKVLLDTCTFIWLNNEASELSQFARDLILDSDNELYLSSISAWEISVKYGLRRLPLPEPPARWIPSRRAINGIRSLSLDEESALQLPKLPPIHSDPFDRIIICQSLIHGLPILTPDEEIAAYPVRVLW